jgi:hypothetical protein
MKLVEILIGAVKRMGREMLYLGWTLAGTGLVLVTLSSTTLHRGIYISVAGLGMHLLGTVLDYIDDEKESDKNEE